MDSYVAALGIVAHAATPLHTVVIYDLIDASLLILTELNSVNSLHLWGDNRHADCHVTSTGVAIFYRFHAYSICRNDLLTGLVLHFYLIY